MAEPLDLCDLRDGERIVHLRVRVGKSRAQIAAVLGWHPDTYRSWELTGGAEDKMSGEQAWECDPNQADWRRWAPAPFFDRDMLQRGAMVDGDWRPPAYGPYQYGNPRHFAAFEVPAGRLRQALQRTRKDREAQLEELLRG
uniref:helix-turn-helix domain-containing protein n=1 Tax=Nonomuraea sp. CA-252377 TaxID=3240003 RepID=UPI003F493CC3